jgi:hypothetical protein
MLFLADMVWKDQSFATGGWTPNEAFVEPAHDGLAEAIGGDEFMVSFGGTARALRGTEEPGKGLLGASLEEGGRRGRCLDTIKTLVLQVHFSSTEPAGKRWFKSHSALL